MSERAQERPLTFTGEELLIIHDCLTPSELMLGRWSDDQAVAEEWEARGHMLPSRDFCLKVGVALLDFDNRDPDRQRFTLTLSEGELWILRERISMFDRVHIPREMEGRIEVVGQVRAEPPTGVAILKKVYGALLDMERERQVVESAGEGGMGPIDLDVFLRGGGNDGGNDGRSDGKSDGGSGGDGDDDDDGLEGAGDRVSRNPRLPNLPR